MSAHTTTASGPHTVPLREIFTGRRGRLLGLLVAAAVNREPAIYGGVIARVPFVDPVTAMLREDEPLTITERDEWGDPLHSPEDYRRLLDYAPYDNVRDEVYPPVLALASTNDTRVRVHQAAKWVARLRATARGGPILLRTTFDAGHRGKSGRYDAWRDEAATIAWIVGTVSPPRKDTRDAG